MLPLPANSNEVIPGYTITQRIGAGGYGEVWRADAPGGLVKAVKFIYGCLDDQRARHELRALEHIKQVRHPFLLNLERIEVVEGQLVIITELADGSLKDRFDACREAGQPGIPRDELLAHLHDAADALDYMSQQHSLQHLDVKPENLLIVGGRVKVADFGLVKDLHGRSISLMTGLTPIYAAPEVFDNRPSTHSDQYSLAIVYQELLTGVLPFPGQTPAQLASQHLGTRPQLTVLPPADRPIVARALAKDPGDRYPTCRELIESLLHPPEPGTASSVDHDARVPQQQPGDTTPVAGKKTDTRTVALDACMAEDDPDSPAAALPERHEAGATSPIDPWLARLAGLACEPLSEPLDAEPAPVEPAAARLRPTLVVGLGGTGLRTLCRFKRRLADRFGSTSVLPSVAVLAVDADAKAMGTFLRDERFGAFAANEALAAPLRRAQDYRTDAPKILRWLSRRWLFNLPRSQQPEGIRPLGRLAFLDHRAKFVEHVGRALAAIRQSEALDRSARTTGMTAEAATVRVVVVASISGGTGGGMVADVADALREAAAAGGLDVEIVGLLTHATPRIPSAKTLAVANACACLSELDRHGIVHSDGDSPGPAALDAAYLVHLGDDLNEAQVDAAAGVLAEFLCLSAVTPAGAFFEQSREADRKAAAQGEGAWRSFGLCQIGCSRGDLPLVAAEELCRRLLDRWRGLTPSAAAARGAADAAGPEPDKRLELELDVGRLAEQVDGVLHELLGGKPDARFAEALRRARDPRTAGDGGAAAVAAAVEEVLGACDLTADPEEAPPDSLQRALTTRLRELSAEQGEAVSHWILELVDASSARLKGSLKAAGWVAERLRQLESKLGVMRGRIQSSLARAKQGLADGASPEATPSKGWLHIRRTSHAAGAGTDHAEAYFRLRLDELALTGTGVLLRALRTDVAELTDRLRDLDGQLSLTADLFAAASSWGEALDVSGPASGAWHDLQLALADALRAGLPELAEALDHQLTASILQPHGGLHAFVAEGPGLDGAFLEQLRTAARTTIAEALGRLDVAGRLLTSGRATGEADEGGDLVRSALELARPTIAVGGGARRLLVVCPEQAAGALAAAVRDRGQSNPAVVVDRSGEVIVCWEIGRLSANRLAASLVVDRPDCAELAARLHTRLDVAWSDLDAGA
ncbi:MAG: protein kinase [Pirellulales bacterium]|nr:protein kinase [Pirellulales bacterium]